MKFRANESHLTPSPTAGNEVICSAGDSVCVSHQLPVGRRKVAGPCFQGALPQSVENPDGVLEPRSRGFATLSSSAALVDLGGESCLLFVSMGCAVTSFFPSPAPLPLAPCSYPLSAPQLEVFTLTDTSGNGWGVQSSTSHQGQGTWTLSTPILYINALEVMFLLVSASNAITMRQLGLLPDGHKISGLVYGVSKLLQASHYCPFQKTCFSCQSRSLQLSAQYLFGE